jgi:tetratricopeptide (TPR) repeat protein
MQMPKRTLSPWKLPIGLLAAYLLVAFIGVQPATAQTNGDSEPTRQEVLTHYSLYFEDFKNENYASALPNLRWILDNAPAQPNNDDRNFRRAVELYSALAEQAESESDTQAYLDTAYTIVNDAPSRLEEIGADYSEFSWTMRKGRFLQQYGEQMPDVSDDPVTYYREAFNIAPDKMQAYYIDRIVSTYLNNGEQQKALTFMDEVEAALSDDSEVMNVVNQYRQQVFGRNPQARIEFLETKLEQNPDDPQIMGDLFELYTQQGQRQKASDLSEKLLQMSPSLEIYRQIAEMRLEDGEAQRAFELYQTAESSTDAPLTAQDYFNMGEAQQQMGNLRQARSYYRQAIEQDQSFGDAYIAIGDLYAQAVSECGGSKMGRGDKAVYWLAVDMYQQAKSADSSVASTADSKINTYVKYFPTAEDIFYRDDMEQGQSFRVDYGCYSWINETTTVRQAS